MRNKIHGNTLGHIHTDIEALHLGHCYVNGCGVVIFGEEVSMR